MIDLEVMASRTLQEAYRRGLQKGYKELAKMMVLIERSNKKQDVRVARRIMAQYEKAMKRRVPQ